jgi:spore germination cell wall hydrolase CwlJ-like protein
MSDVEKRQTQQRAVTVAACAAAFAVGGPLVGHRFETQKTHEAYRAEAAKLAGVLEATQSDWRQLATAEGEDAGIVKASFTNYTAETAQTELSGLLKILPMRERDTASLRNLMTFLPESLGAVEEKQTELDCLAQAIYYEARSEGPRGQVAVAEVVMNRVADSRFPNTVCDVVYQGRYRATGCQFTFTCDGSLRVKPRGAAWDRARAVALHMQMGLSKPVTNGATHYHTDYVNPYWSPGLVETAVVGTHIFYRFPKSGQEWRHAQLALAANNEHRETVDMLEADALAQESLRIIEAEAEAVPEMDGFITISAEAPVEQPEVLTLASRL